MFFEEPKVEFIVLGRLDTTATNSCNNEATKSDPSSGTCTGCEAPSNNCSGTMMPPGSIKEAKGQNKAETPAVKAEPKTVVGFDLTFDR